VTGGLDRDEPGLSLPTAGPSPESVDELLGTARDATDLAEQTALLEQVHARLSGELAEALGD